MNKLAEVVLDMSQIEGALEPIDPSSFPVVVKCKILIIEVFKDKGIFREN